MEAQRSGRGKDIAQISLTSGLDESGRLKPRPSHFTPRERPDTHCMGGWVGPRAGQGGCA